MALDFKKKLALRTISAGMRLPESQLDKITELIHLKQLINLLGINCILDVGANEGQFALELRGIGFKGLIVSFEPLHGAFQRLQQTFSRDACWKGYQVALGRQSVQTKINVIPHLTVMSSLLHTTSKWPNVQTEDITVRRLDEMFDAAVGNLTSPKIMLKMDTQGYDLEVFAGAQGCLESILGLQSELSVVPLYHGMPHYLEALSTYEEAGFELFDFSVVSRTKDQGLQELNCLMKRRET